MHAADSRDITSIYEEYVNPLANTYQHVYIRSILQPFVSLMTDCCALIIIVALDSTNDIKDKVHNGFIVSLLHR
jgi:hypothetical protein